MLILSRKKNESIVINEDVTVVVVEIRGDKVRLGVEAPKEVPVHRREVFDAIHRNGGLERTFETNSENSDFHNQLGQYFQAGNYSQSVYDYAMQHEDLLTPDETLKLAKGLGVKLYQH